MKAPKQLLQRWLGIEAIALRVVNLELQAGTSSIYPEGSHFIEKLEEIEASGVKLAYPEQVTFTVEQGTTAGNVVKGYESN